MAGLFPALAVTYAAGVAAGLVATDARPGARIGLALAWPIGPIAFVMTVALLLAVTPVAFSGRRRSAGGLHSPRSE